MHLGHGAGRDGGIKKWRNTIGPRGKNTLQHGKSCPIYFENIVENFDNNLGLGGVTLTLKDNTLTLTRHFAYILRREERGEVM